MRIPQSVPVQEVAITLNAWHLALIKYETTMAGELPFLEFTVDASGFEVAPNTPKSDAYFNAPWAIPSGSSTEAILPRYVSAWEQLYHPDLIERARVQSEA